MTSGFPCRHWRKWARPVLLGLVLAAGQAAGSDGRRRNSFLPQLTAIAGVISTGNASVDAALQQAVSHHLQGWFLSSTQLYADAARVAPTNVDCFMGAALAYHANPVCKSSPLSHLSFLPRILLLFLPPPSHTHTTTTSSSSSST